MHTIDLTAECAGVSADAAYGRIADFETHAEHVGAVRSVRVERESAIVALSSWEVDFRTGILIWTERDEFDAIARTITFSCVGGDPDHFSGSWCVRAAGAGSVVRFEARFALGLDAFAEMIDPLVERALYDNVAEILHGLFGTAATLVGPAPSER